MPYVNIKVAGRLSRKEKEEIVKEIANTLWRVAKKPKEATYIVIDEVNKENWAKGEVLLG